MKRLEELLGYCFVALWLFLIIIQILVTQSISVLVHTICSKDGICIEDAIYASTSYSQWRYPIQIVDLANQKYGGRIKTHDGKIDSDEGLYFLDKLTKEPYNYLVKEWEGVLLNNGDITADQLPSLRQNESSARLCFYRRNKDKGKLINFSSMSQGSILSNGSIQSEGA